MRIVHHFSDGFFYNDEADEERVEILEEIQLFDKQTKINQISLLKYVNKLRQFRLRFLIYAFIKVMRQVEYQTS